jgi:ABC-type amino acid transport substrate-binding protein
MPSNVPPPFASSLLTQPKRWLVAAALPAALLGPLAAQAADDSPRTVVRIATNNDRTFMPPAEGLLRKAYASMGLDVEFVHLPLARAAVELRAGNVDAVAMRVDGFFQQLSFMRKVPVPLVTLNVYAYGRPPCPAGLSVEELGKHKIGLQRGMVAAEALVPEASRVPANTPSDAFLNLSAGASDYVLTLTTPWMAEIPIEARKAKLCRVPAPLSVSPVYHGVIESHAAWIAPLEQALRGMTERGEVQQAWMSYERQVATPNARLQAQPGRSLTVTPAMPASAPALPPR